MLYRLKDGIRRLRFARACDGVRRAPPASVDSASGMVVVSQLQHKDVLLFLLALKSFTRRVRPRAVCVLDDGSLTAEDRAELSRHVPDLRLLDRVDFRSAHCPAGGTWERLLAISDLVRDHYVVQLDSDTLTVGSIAEVRDCVERQGAFALGTWDRQRIETMRERCATAQDLIKRGDDHVQVVAEAHFDRLADFESLCYVRGCSGFAGFPRGSFERSFVEKTSAQMFAAIGEKWAEWGSEQVMSNIVLANIPSTTVLPHPKYADCHKMRSEVTEFIHFIGSCRFDGERYARLGAQVIATL
jgi:hypothetical protein